MFRSLLCMSGLFGMSLLASAETADNSQSIKTELNKLFDTSATQSKLPPEKPLYLKIIKSKTADRATLIYRCRNVTARSIVDSVESATSPSGTVEVSSEQNLITVNDISEQIEEIRETILTLDTRAPQILVEAQIVEVQMSDGYEKDNSLNINYFDADKNTTSSVGSALGERLNYYNAASETNSAISASTVNPGQLPNSNGSWFDVTPINADMGGGDILSVNAKLRWLQNNDTAKILSSPNLIVDLGATASVSTGEDIPLLKTDSNNSSTSFSVYYKRTGVNLRVTPVQINEDAVTLQVRPEVTSVVRTEILNATTTAPVISVRNIDTKLNIKDGGVVMMGGLYSSRDIERNERVPVLSEMPLVGQLFTSISTENVLTQLIFLLKVTIVPDDSMAVLGDIDRTKVEVESVGRIIQDSVESTISEKVEQKDKAEETE